MNGQVPLREDFVEVNNEGESWRMAEDLIEPIYHRGGASMTNQVTQVITGLDFLPLPPPRRE